MLPLFVLAHFGHHLLTALPVPLLPLIRDDFALNYTQAGLVVSAFSLSYGIGQLPAGWLADRIGPRVLITIGIGGVAIAGLLVGLSRTYIMMVVLLVVMGLAGGSYHPSATPLIATSVEPKDRGKALGFHVMGGSGSYFLAPLIAAAIAAVWGWRGPFIGLAIPTAIFGIVFYVLLGRRQGSSKDKLAAADPPREIPSQPLRLRHIVVFLILSTSAQAITNSTVAFIPLFVVDHFGIGKEAAASFIAIYYSAGLWAGPLGGYISDRLGRIPVVLACCLIAGLFIYLLNVIPYNSIGIGALLLAIGMATSVRSPTSEAYLIGQTAAGHRSTVIGIYYFSAMETGAVLTPLLGYLVDRFGFNTSFTIASITLVAVTLVCSLFLRNRRD